MRANLVLMTITVLTFLAGGCRSFDMESDLLVTATNFDILRIDMQPMGNRSRPVVMMYLKMPDAMRNEGRDINVQCSLDDDKNPEIGVNYTFEPFNAANYRRIDKIESTGDYYLSSMSNLVPNDISANYTVKVCCNSSISTIITCEKMEYEVDGESLQKWSGAYEEFKGSDDEVFLR